MSNFERTRQELRYCIYAGVPLVMVRSPERPRVERIVRSLANGEGLSVFYYTEARQLQGFNADMAAKDLGSDPLPFANELFMKSRHVVFVLGDTRKLDQDSLYTRELLSTVYLAKETGNTLVTVAAESVWPRLSRFGLQIDLDFPDFGERVALVRDFREKQKEKVTWGEDEVTQLATLSRGLSEMQIVNMMRSALVERGALTRDDIYAIASRKETLFAPVPNVVPVSNRLDLEVAGLGSLKAWLDGKRNVFFAPQELLQEYDLQAPKGILLVGVPGCGKSYSARMVASRWELPLYRFDLVAVYDKYVGETERKMQEALDYIDDVAPCVLWIDEIEKALASSSGESDVGKRVLGQFLFWLQESSARVFLVATANDVTKLPPELFRKGRFSETFFVDLPGMRERAEVLGLYARKSLHVSFRESELAALAKACEGFSYSDIEQCVKDVAEEMLFSSVHEDPFQALSKHLAETLPISQTNDSIAAVREWGIGHARAASLEVTNE
ncbi:MAG: AAA family ATPase [Eggerthellaceae bacterium]|nr:AAA family ATPase [Eggerthellaceae bacterium]